MRDWNSEVRSRLASADLPPARTMEIVEELAQHLRDRCEEFQSKGLSQAAAEEAIIAELNDGSLERELSRIETREPSTLALGEETSSGGFLRSIWQDIRYGLRILRLNRSFTIVCVASLALGIGANSAIFQLINSVRLRNLPVPDPQSLAIVRIADRKFVQGRSTGRYADLSFPIWKEIERRQQGFSSISAWAPSSFNLTTSGQVRYARGIYVSGSFFGVLQQSPLLGRLIVSSDDTTGCATGPAVISHAFWQREFGGDRNVLGRKFTLNDQPFEVVGITQPEFYGVEVGRNFDVAVPLCTEPRFREEPLTSMRHGWWLGSIGRLKPGWTVEKASAQLNSISVPILEATIPTVYNPEAVKKYMQYRFAAYPGGNGFSSLRKEYATPLSLLLTVSAVVLLIACANLANLMLARAGAREREIAVRLALGASRRRLIRQLLTESLLLAIAGAAAGALLATNLSAYLVRYLSTSDSPIYLDRAMDWRVLGFTAALACLTCILFGLAPALRASRTAPARVMNAAGRAVTATRERIGARQVLVIAQVGLSLMLLVGALLFVRTLRNLLYLDPGFQREGVAILDTDFMRLKLPPADRVPFSERLLEQVRSVPGVTSAAETYIIPVSGSGWNNNVVVDGKVKDADVNMNNISAGYFATMNIGMVAGRDFNANDTANSPKVAIVNQEFARKVFGTEDVIGRTFKIDVYKGDPQHEFQIVGIVKNSKYYDLREEFSAMAYYPLIQNDKPDLSTEIMVRSELPLAALTADVQRALDRVNHGVSVDVISYDEMIKEGLLRERLLATLAGFFAVLAGVLATVGLYGVIAYMVLRRTNEIGIRIALGARPQQILVMVVREALRLLAFGCVLGVALSLAATRTASTLLFGLKSYDPTTMLLAASVLAAVSILATLIPANRAARTNPVTALREQ
jgi:putative ABC transport system permease protein